MKFIKTINIILIMVFLLLLAFDLLLVLPEYCACHNASEDITVTTIWGYELDCIGDTAEFSLVFFQLIGFVALLLSIIILILHCIYRGEAKKLKKAIDE